MSIDTTSSGSGPVNDIQSLPQGKIRGRTKLVSITEDVQKFAAEQGITEDAALEVGLKEKTKEFIGKGGRTLYTNVGIRVNRTDPACD